MKACEGGGAKQIQRPYGPTYTTTTRNEALHYDLVAWRGLRRKFVRAGTERRTESRLRAVSMGVTYGICGGGVIAGVVQVVGVVAYSRCCTNMTLIASSLNVPTQKVTDSTKISHLKLVV